MSLNGTKFLAHGAGNVKLGKDISVDHSESPALGGWESVGEPQNMRVAFFFQLLFCTCALHQTLRINDTKM